MKSIQDNSHRLFKLLGNLSPDLLADAFPEAGEAHNAANFRARHARRIAKMALLYAACAALLVGAIVYLPRLFDQTTTPVTTVPGEDVIPEGYPTDYFRPDLVWANEKADLRKDNAVVGKFHTIDFEFLEDESAVYAIYIQYFDGKYLTNYSRDFAENSGAYMKHLGVSSDDQYRILEDFNARYYEGTREQIMLYFNYIEKTYTSSDDSKRIHVRLAFQTLKPGVSSGAWNPALLQISEDTGYSATVRNFLNCIDARTDTPVIRPDAKELTVFFSTQAHTPPNASHKPPASMTHTVHYQPEGPELAILIGETWYDIPWTAPIGSKESKLEIPKEGEVSLTLSFESFPHGELPVGQYRLNFPFKAIHHYSDGSKVTENETRAVLFMVSTGDDCISPGASQGLVYTQLEDGTYSVNTSGFYRDQALVIPEVYCGVTVTEIADGAFFHQTSITSVTLPNSITEIGAAAFSSCSALKQIVIPDSVQIIPARAFWGCNLQELTLPSGITEIGEEAFSYNPLHKLVLPDTLVTIGKLAFLGSSTTQLVIPASVQRIGAEAFSSCNKLQTVTFEDPHNWITDKALLDLTSPTDNAQKMMQMAVEIRHGTVADIDTFWESAMWSIDDANVQFDFANYEEAERFCKIFHQYSKQILPLPNVEGPDVTVRYQFYGITADGSSPTQQWEQPFKRGMIVVVYESETVTLEGEFYAIPFLPDPDGHIYSRELSHESVRRTYWMMFDELVYSHLVITAKDPGQYNTPQYHNKAKRLFAQQVVLPVS